MIRVAVTVVFCVLIAACGSRPAATGLYYWKTSLDWSDADTARLSDAGVDRVGLRLFDWGERGEEGPLAVRNAIPASVDVEPVVYVTVAKLEAWTALHDPGAEAGLLLSHVDTALSAAWKGGVPRTYQLDADWTARTKTAWFAVAASFRELVHARKAQFEVTVRLHQYRDRTTQGIPPADRGVLMLYGAGDAVLDPTLVHGYLTSSPYPLPLVPAFPVYSQARQYNGYGRLVALHRLGSDASLPLDALRSDGPDRYTVLKRASLGGRTLLAHDTLAVDRVTAGDLETVSKLPEVLRLRHAAGDRVWVFDYDPQQWEALVHGPLAPRLFPR